MEAEENAVPRSLGDGDYRPSPDDDLITSTIKGLYWYASTGADGVNVTFKSAEKAKLVRKLVQFKSTWTPNVPEVVTFYFGDYPRSVVKQRL